MYVYIYIYIVCVCVEVFQAVKRYQLRRLKKELGEEPEGWVQGSITVVLQSMKVLICVYEALIYECMRP